MTEKLKDSRPPWAKWLSFDKDGSMTYFSDKPRLIKSGGFWATKFNEYGKFINPPAWRETSPNWRKS